MSRAAPDVRESRPDDAEAILGISRAVAVFSREEIDTVEELLGDWGSLGPAASGYHFLSCEIDGRVAGFACYGPRPLTEGAYDLYWIAADPAWQGHGAGGALSARCVEEVRALDGRLLIAETSGLPKYAPTRRFYETHGYRREATIADFYAPGDDLVVYVLRLN
jgi:ribosomal protein S18 acetylase RimI-like enzyme